MNAVRNYGESKEFKEAADELEKLFIKYGMIKSRNMEIFKERDDDK